MTSGVSLTLSQTKPDFESLVIQLQLFLNSRATWADLLTSSTGQTLIEMMASVGAFNQFAIESAAREGFLRQAVRASSIYAIVRMLGVRITRKIPASASATLTRTGDLTFPLVIRRLTQFTVNGVPFFNRASIVFAPGSAASGPAELYEGTIRQQTIPADSTAFREIYLNEPGFIVSNVDVEVTLTNPVTNVSEVWSPIVEGIWTAAPTDKVYYDSTDGEGDVVLAFGDGHSGFLPALGNNILVNYAVTQGSVGSVGSSGLVVALSTNTTVSGVTTSQVTGGADEKTPEYYRVTAPHIYKARNRAVTPVDYKAIASSYPGVASATIQAQKDIAPGDLRWMNLIRVCILPENSDAFSDAQWTTFLEWFDRATHAAVDIQKYDPLKVIADVELVLFLRPAGVPAEIVPEVEDNIRALFVKNKNTLGRRLAKSDIEDACKLEQVDYINLITPTTDVTVLDTFGKADVLKFIALGTLKVTAQYSERESA